MPRVGCPPHPRSMSTLTALEVQRQHTRNHAHILRRSTAKLRSPRCGDPPAVIAAVEALAAEQDRVADVLDACADTDNPLEGAAILCEMQAFQRSPGTPAERAWSEWLAFYAASLRSQTPFP